MRRRHFLRAMAGTGAGLLFLPKGPLYGQNAPGNRLNIALIGVWGRALAHYDTLASENVVALCDINDNYLANATKKWPQAKTYTDWRQCLDQPGLDAVVCCTPDHHHAFVANWAMNRGLHVYCEKPIGLSVEEVRLVRATYLKHKGKLATQHGTQRHAYPNFQRLRELIVDGAIGELRQVSAWDSRKIGRPGYPPAEGEPPGYLHYEQWLGPSPYHPYNRAYFSSTVAGLNCLQWNMFWDFGAGQVGDMGSHTMDLVWNAIDASAPLTAEAQGDKLNPEVCPVELKATFEHAANQWRPAITVSWYQGGLKPAPPKPYVDLNRMGNGAVFEGSKGYIVADFTSRVLIPGDNDGDLTYFKRRSKNDLLAGVGGSEGLSQRTGGERLFQQEWVDACKGDKRTSCDFDYAGTMMEQMLLALVAYRVGKKLEYDSGAGRVTNVPEANEFLSRKYRSGWSLNG
ncbi:MAG: Gfo/Idh/MocA family oxidoreductase [Verrucomicrobiota bacterium]